ncbi:MAG: DUF4340 domain-containing protein [Gammaproteobacteria bacterium]|nr:DUF4340 domain-containing protein [Gammaproteobacteria bacterium]
MLMKATKTNKRSLLIILAIVAIAILALAMFVGASRRADVDTAETESWLPNLAQQINQIDRITMSKTGGEKLTLRRGEDYWHVVEKFEHRADAGQIRKLLLAMSDARILEQKTSNSEFFPRLGVQDVSAGDAPGTQIELGNVSPSINVIIGDIARSGGGTYVRGVNEQKTFLIDQALTPSANKLNWLDREVLDVVDSDIQSITVTQVDGSKLQIAKADTENDKFAVLNLPVDAKLQSESSANAAASALTAMQFDEVQAFDAEKFSGKPVVAVYRLYDGRDITASSWAMPAIDDEQQYLTRFEVALNEERARQYQVSQELNKIPVDQQPFADSDGVDTKAELSINQESSNAASVGDIDMATVDAAINQLAKETQALNERLAPWVYKFPGYKQAHLTRRLDELLSNS